MKNIVDKIILGKLIEELINNDYRVEISDQDGGGLHLYAHPDHGTMPADGATHWVRLIEGNGYNLINDYSVNLESVMEPVQEFTDNLEKMFQGFREML